MFLNDLIIFIFNMESYLLGRLKNNYFLNSFRETVSETISMDNK